MVVFDNIRISIVTFVIFEIVLQYLQHLLQIKAALSDEGVQMYVKNFSLTLNIMYLTTITYGYMQFIKCLCWVENKYETFLVNKTIEISSLDEKPYPTHVGCGIRDHNLPVTQCWLSHLSLIYRLNHSAIEDWL